MRYLKLRSRLELTRGAYPDLALVVYEAAHQRGGAATEYAIGCATTIQAWCAERGLEHASVHSATLKKHSTGTGRASKDEMREHGRRRFAVHQAMSDDEIDALWILDYATAVLVPARSR